MIDLSLIKVQWAIIEEQRLYIEQLKESLTSIRSFDYTQDRVDSSPEQDKIGTVMARIDSAENALKKMEVEYVVMVGEALDLIRTLKDLKQEKVLIYHYLKFMTFTDIGEEMDLSPKYVREIHEGAMSSLQSASSSLESAKS